MQTILKRYAALALAVCLILATLAQPALAVEIDDGIMTADETGEIDLTESDTAATADLTENDEETAPVTQAVSGEATVDDDSDSSEYAYATPNITAIGTTIESGSSYVYITWEVVDEADYLVYRSEDGGEYEYIGDAACPGEDDDGVAYTEVTYQDTTASLYHTYAYKVCCTDDGETAASGYGVSASHYFPSGSCGDNVTWTLSSSGVLTISGSGDMVDAWDAGYAAWYPIRTEVKSVQIGEDITSLAPYVFQECTALTSVSIPDAVTRIGDCAFFGCTGLTSVTIPEGVTEIPYRTFYLCTALTDVSLPSTVTTIGDGAFGSCTSLTGLTLPSGLTELGNSAFYKCTSLTSLVIPDGVTVLPMNVLYGCTGLTSLTLPDGLTELGIRALFNCTSLTSLELPDTLTTIGSGALQRCSGLTELTIPASVTSIGADAFYACTGLETVYFLGAPPETLCDWFGDTACTAIVTEEYYDAWFALDLTAAGSEVTWRCEDSLIEYLDAPTVSVANASTGVTVTWNAVENAEGYYVYRKTGGGWTELGSTTSASYTDTTASSGTTYSYTVCAYAGEVVSDYGTGCSILYLAQPDFTLENASSGVKVTWSTVSGAAKYWVCRKTAGGSWSTLCETTSTSYTDTTASGGVVYYYTVRAINGSARSSYDSSTTIVRLTQPEITLSNAINGIKVTWGTVSGATGYRVYRKTSSSSWQRIATVSGSTLTYTDTSVKSNSNTTYYYTVRAISDSTLSSFDGSMSILYLATPEVSLTGDMTGVTITWNKVTGATGYRVYRKTSGSSWQQIATVSNGSTVSYTDTAVKDSGGTTYYYTVRAVKGSVLSSYVTDQFIVRLSQPTVTLSNASNGIKVTWGTVSGATGYRVYRKTSSSSWQRIATVSGSTLTYTDTAVADNSGTTYYYTVRAVSDNDISSYVTNKSIIRLSQPEITLANTATGVKISWSKVTGATSYRVYRKTVGGSWQNLASVSSNTLSYTDTAVAEDSGTTYYYTARAVSGSTLGSYDSSKYILYLAQPTVTLLNGTTGIKVSWGEVCGATSYFIYRKSVGGSWQRIATASGSTLTYMDTTVAEDSGVTYYYTVRAVKGSVLSSYVTDTSVVRLSQPEITLTNVATGVKISWSKVTGATSYRVYRKTVGGSWQNLASVSSSILSYTDTAVADDSGTTYYYTVRAVSGSTLGSYDSSKFILYLSQPTVTLTNAATGVTVTWNKVTGATSYRVYRKVSGGSWKTLTTVSGSTLSYMDTAVADDSGTTYYYTVRAISGSTLSSYDSSCSIAR